MIELFGCSAELLDDLEHVRASMRAAVIAAGGTLLGECAHDFEPQGVTVVGLLADSHISVHTWPEHRYAAADVFTCGITSDPEAAGRSLAVALQAEHHELRTVERGLLGGLERPLR